MVTMHDDDATALACGHEPTPTAHTPGYALTRAGERICYACADQREREWITEHDAFTGYLSQDGTRITTWTGGELARVFGLKHGRRTNYGRMVHVTATADGRVWRGSSGNGEGGAITLRTTSKRA